MSGRAVMVQVTRARSLNEGRTRIFADAPIRVPAVRQATTPTRRAEPCNAEE
jgi:hypothetical protein